MIRLVFVLLAVLALSSCASKYRVDTFEAPTSRLDGNSSFYVMLPENGRYGADIYQASGMATAQAAATALAVHVKEIVTATSVETLDEAFGQARSQGVTHIFHPTILHWEDRATEWSGITDKITLKFAVYDAQTEELLSSTVARASSKWGTFGGDHPQDLLPVPTQQFVDQLF